MLNSKQRAKLKGLGSKETTIIYVGKGQINEQIIKQTSDALKKRELVKGSVLDNSSYSVSEVAKMLAEETKSEVVHTIGSKFVLYKRNEKKPVIEI